MEQEKIDKMSNKKVRKITKAKFYHCRVCGESVSENDGAFEGFICPECLESINDIGGD